MNRRMLFPLAFVWLLLASCSALAGAEADEFAKATALMQGMTASFREQTYDGVLVLNRGGEMRSVRIVHVVKDGQEYERLVYLDGKPLQVVRGAHDIDCVHVGQRLLLDSAAGHLFGHYSAGSQGTQLHGYYQLELLAPGRVAGRPSSVVLVRPTDEHRYSYRLHLDRASGLLLKSEVLGAGETVLESAQFSQIMVGDAVDPQALEPVGDDVVFEDFHGVPVHLSKARATTWRLGWKPAGFMPAAHQRHAVEDQPQVSSQHFTDGLALFSVFVEATSKPVSVFQSRNGSTQAYVAPRKLGGTWASVSVVGEVPLATAVRIAEGVEPAIEQGASTQAGQQ